MKRIQNYVNKKYINNNKWIEMASSLGQIENFETSSAEEIAIIYNFKFNPQIPTTPQDWEEFINESTISQLLMERVIDSNKLTLRKMIADLSTKKQLSQNEVRALEAMKFMIKPTKDENNRGTTYIQYLAPAAYQEIDIELDEDKIA